MNLLKKIMFALFLMVNSTAIVAAELGERQEQQEEVGERAAVAGNMQAIDNPAAGAAERLEAAFER